MVQFIELMNGSDIPVDCVDAINLFELRWPGASFPNARAAIAGVVLEAAHKLILEECDDTPEVRKVLEVLGWHEPEADDEAVHED